MDISNQPGLYCITWGHILVENVEPGAWPVRQPDRLHPRPWAQWCLFCGSGVSNELLPEDLEDD